MEVIFFCWLSALLVQILIRHTIGLRKIFNFGPILGPFEAKGVLLGALGAQKRPDTRSMCLLTMIPAQSYQLAAVGTKAGPSGPSKSLWSPQKGLLGPKKALLGALGAHDGSSHE